MTTTFRLPEPYTPARLVAAMRHARENPDARYVTRAGDEMTAAGYQEWFRRCLAEKINRNEPWRGRKDDRLWLTEMTRAARALNTPRLRIRWLPADLRERFAHRLARHDD